MTSLTPEPSRHVENITLGDLLTGYFQCYYEGCSRLLKVDQKIWWKPENDCPNTDFLAFWFKFKKNIANLPLNELFLKVQWRMGIVYLWNDRLSYGTPLED